MCAVLLCGAGGVREWQGVEDGSLLLWMRDAGHYCISFRLYLNMLVNRNERSWKWRVSYEEVRIKKRFRKIQTFDPSEREEISLLFIVLPSEASLLAWYHAALIIKAELCLGKVTR
jgi:hypothetical protein